MTHLWVRAEQRANEERVGLMPDGAAALIAAGFRVTVEDSSSRAVPLESYRAVGCDIAPEGSWPGAPDDAIVFGLKELPEDGTPLRHRHILFGHAYKGQPAGRVLLDRFRAGGGVLYDLESLVDENGRRLAAFGYWAGFAGAAVALKCLAAQGRDEICGPVARYTGRAAMVADVVADLGAARPRVIVIGALGRVGTGAADLCEQAGLAVTRWDIAETARGAPFPEVMAHEVFLNCILARPGCPVFVPADAGAAPRALRVIGDIACDPTSEFSPIKVYDRVTDWAQPALRVHDDPPLDVMAIDNLPSLLPLEASEDYAAQLLDVLRGLDRIDEGAWGRARVEFQRHL
ncbi:MAG: saccharopine dehydrogenase [Gemmobacter sp.]|nr:saccharopine dehydrogenase [Gemmobacter sp.]